jgi:hypothetical protein
LNVAIVTIKLLDAPRRIVPDETSNHPRAQDLRRGADNPVWVYFAGTIDCITFAGGNHLYSIK